MYVEKETKTCGQKSFCLFNVVWRRPHEHTKTFFCKMFFSSSLKYMKNVFSIISRFVKEKNVLVLSIQVIFPVRYINICITRIFFLDENPETRFSGMNKKLQKATKI